MAETNDTTEVEYRQVVVDGVEWFAYRVGVDGSVWSRWRRISLGKGHGSRMEIGEKWKQMKPRSCARGYLYITLCGFGIEVDRAITHLVLEAFDRPRPEGMEACHDPDRNPANCNRSNLRWDTPKNNNADKVKHGTALRGEKQNGAKLMAEQVHIIRSRKGVEPQYRTALEFKVGRQAVAKIQNRKTWAWLPEKEIEHATDV